LVTVLDAQFGEDAVEVTVDGAHRQTEPIGDFTIGQASPHQVRNFSFTVGDR
jgi:hypothetical protein